MDFSGTGGLTFQNGILETVTEEVLDPFIRCELRDLDSGL